ncbi:MAG: 2-hydroxychromene-2-carboxylate isomerase [Alphaproteobacteria bacterium MarineAlpha3_Bin5]|nr:MAG: 2-hydroxychromene-2-carboxylate isomerase [Alphaproteobacteria bacterium MarineAlpha3_Bin5]|tara:strand:+ start:42 stop:644 length:603 start_codon:yes stop_codon:yes gene_type:complete
MSKKITAWLSIGSTYTYLTALRINDIKREHNLVLDIKPISIRQIMKAMDNIPFPPSKKSKVDYMWRDIERRAQFYGLPKPKLPAPYPLKEFDRANLIGIVLNTNGKFLEYFEETYRVWFLEGLEAGSEKNLRKCTTKLSLNYDEIVAKSCKEEVQEEYETNTSEAQKLGIFGAPSFTIGNEVFWGDDRLEDAIRFLGRSK